MKFKESFLNDYYLIVSMLKELKYRFDSRDDFDLQQHDGIIDENDLEKILAMRIRNHHKLKNIKSQAGSPSFIIVNPRFMEESLCERKKLSELVSLSAYNWIGHFNRHGSHEIIFPCDDKDGYEFRQTGFSYGDAVHFKGIKTSFWSGAGHFDYQKDAFRVPLFSNVRKGKLIELLDSVYGKPEEYPTFRS